MKIYLPDGRDYMLVLLAVLLAAAFVFLRPSHGGEDKPVVTVAYKFFWTHKNESASGTCFAVAPTQVLTARHCLYDEGKRRDCWVIVSGVKYPAELVRENADLDIALCEIKGVLLVPLEVRDTPNPIGLILKVPAFPRGVFKESLGAIEKHYWNGTVKSVANVSFDHGMSGGPIIRGDGVFGMFVAGIPKGDDLDKSRGLYLPASVLLWFLKL